MRSFVSGRRYWRFSVCWGCSRAIKAQGRVRALRATAVGAVPDAAVENGDRAGFGLEMDLVGVVGHRDGIGFVNGERGGIHYD